MKKSQFKQLIREVISETADLVKEDMSDRKIAQSLGGKKIREAKIRVERDFAGTYTTKAIVLYFTDGHYAVFANSTYGIGISLH